MLRAYLRRCSPVLLRVNACAFSSVGSDGSGVEIIRPSIEQDALVGAVYRLAFTPIANLEKDALPQLNNVHQFVVSVFLGTNRMVYVEKTLADFRWQAVFEKNSGEQLILEVDCEGGSLRLFGIQSGKSWKFRVEPDEYILDSMSDEEVIYTAREKPLVSTWRSASKQLDHYSWTQLHPSFVRFDFLGKVAAALKTREKKGLSIVWDEWNNLLQS